MTRDYDSGFGISRTLPYRNTIDVYLAAPPRFTLTVDNHLTFSISNGGVRATLVYMFTETKVATGDTGCQTLQYTQYRRRKSWEMHDSSHVPRDVEDRTYRSVLQ
jgi:hypothetical protein